MTRPTVREICAHCGQTLPRAAYYRCPSCRQRIARETDLVNIACRRCNRPIPRANANRCVCSAVVSRAHTGTVLRKRRLQ